MSEKTTVVRLSELSVCQLFGRIQCQSKVALACHVSAISSTRQGRLSLIQSIRKVLKHTFASSVNNAFLSHSSVQPNKSHCTTAIAIYTVPLAGILYVRVLTQY